MKYKIIKIGASWCGPCRVLDNKLKGFNRCEITKYDVDDMDDELLDKFKVRNVPVTLILDENDNEIAKWVGLFDVNELETKLDELENA